MSVNGCDESTCKLFVSHNFIVCGSSYRVPDPLHCLERRLKQDSRLLALPSQLLARIFLDAYSLALKGGVEGPHLVQKRTVKIRGEQLVR